MAETNTYIKPFVVLALVLVLVFLANISLGSVSIPLKDVLNSLFGGTIQNESWDYIIQNYRIPKAFTAIIVGSGLGISGLLMQTLFRNPLAGPFVLGISSGASLGVAFVIMGASLFGGAISGMLITKWSLVVAASLGSFLVLLTVLVVSSRVRDTMAILIIGLMFASITAAIVSVLSYFATADELQQYVFWGFGSLGNLSWNELLVLLSVYLVGLVLSVFSIKALNSLLLGENYAKSLGMNLRRNRLIIILATSLLAGTITAFAGPIAFIGLAAPHVTKLVLKTSDHRIVLPVAAVVGAFIMLISDTIAQLPGSEYTLPINAITTLFGAPIVISLLVRKRRMVL